MQPAKGDSSNGERSWHMAQLYGPQEHTQQTEMLALL